MPCGQNFFAEVLSSILRVSNINRSDLEGSQEYVDFLGKEKCASVGILYGDVQGSAQVFLR